MLGGMKARVHRLGSRVRRSLTSVSEPVPARALAWVRANHLPTGGIRVQSGHRHAYPEVTGYLIPTLLAYGEEDLVAQLTEWLVCSQRRDGSFTDPDRGERFIFDTGQVLRGLLAMADRVAGAEQAARRAADYLIASMIDGGRGGFPVQYPEQSAPEPLQLYVLPPLLEAAERFAPAAHRESAVRCRDYYVAHDQFLQIGDLTHFLAYELEALFDLGLADLARPMLTRLAELQRPDGAVRGVADAAWVCVPGLAQLAICWYKVGMVDPADRAMGWLDAHQASDGGFCGSIGPGANYKPRIAVSWGPKFVLDAHLLRVSTFFARTSSQFPTDVAADDGRLLAVTTRVRGSDRVLEVGCGKGRFLKALAAACPGASGVGVDPSPAMIASATGSIETMLGSLENIPCPDESFDVVFTVEALEHSVVQMRGVAEMLRVLKPGGWIVIVDKHRGAWGRMACPPWERWPDAAGMSERLRLDCDEVSGVNVSYDGHPASDGLMMAWAGRKRSRLSGAQWNDRLITSDLESIHADEIRFNEFSEWGRTVVLETRPGDRVLEIGSGTGKISLQLAQAGRDVTCFDSSADSLAFTNRCAAILGLPVATVCGDATETLPFASACFDCVWSSGLLEHFTVDQRRAMLREWARVCRGQLISLVPNAASMAYRLGKMAQERTGVWPYGLEMPLLTLRDDYEAAGLEASREFSVGPEHSLNFLSDATMNRKLRAVFRRLSRPALADLNQGYLLVTIGKVR